MPHQEGIQIVQTHWHMTPAKVLRPKPGHGQVQSLLMRKTIISADFVASAPQPLPLMTMKLVKTTATAEGTTPLTLRQQRYNRKTHSMVTLHQTQTWLLANVMSRTIHKPPAILICLLLVLLIHLLLSRSRKRYHLTLNPYEVQTSQDEGLLHVQIMDPPSQ